MPEHNPLESQVGGALESCHNYRQALWFLWRQTHQPQFSDATTAGKLLLLTSQLLEAEYYTALQHLQKCLQVMMTEAPTLKRCHQLFNESWERSPGSSGLSTEIQETSQDISPTESPSS